MRPSEERFLKSIIAEAGIRFPSRRLASNPLENSYWSNLLDGALNALEVVAIGSLDWKLTAIVKLFKSWLKDRREEKAQLKQKTEWGYNWELTREPTDTQVDPYSRTYY